MRKIFGLIIFIASCYLLASSIDPIGEAIDNSYPEVFIWYCGQILLSLFLFIIVLNLVAFENNLKQNNRSTVQHIYDSNSYAQEEDYYYQDYDDTNNGYIDNGYGDIYTDTRREYANQDVGLNNHFNMNNWQAHYDGIFSNNNQEVNNRVSENNGGSLQNNSQSSAKDHLNSNSKFDYIPLDWENQYNPSNSEYVDNSPELPLDFN